MIEQRLALLTSLLRLLEQIQQLGNGRLVRGWRVRVAGRIRVRRALTAENSADSLDQAARLLVESWDLVGVFQQCGASERFEVEVGLGIVKRARHFDEVRQRNVGGVGGCVFWSQ